MKITSLSKLGSLQLFQLLRFGAPFAISVVLVRLIGRQDIGVYESLVLVGASFTFFWVSGIINTFIPYYHSIAEEKRPALVFNVYFLLCLLSLLCFLVLLSLEPILFRPTVSHPSATVYYCYMAYVLFNAPAFFMEYLLVVNNRTKTVLVYGLVSFSLQVVSVVLPLYWGLSLETAVFALALYGGLKFLLVTGYVLATGKAGGSFELLKPFVGKAVPAILVLLVGGSMPYVDSYIVLMFFDKSSFAIYQYGAREMPLVLLMANALSNVFSGDIAESSLGSNMAQSLEKLRQGSANLMHKLFPLTVLLILASHYLFAHVYSTGFLASAPIFNVFMLLVISRLVFPQTVLTGLLKNKEQLWFSGMEWAINLLLDFVLLYFFGIIGIAYATVVAYFAERAIQVLYLKKMGYAPQSYIPVKTWALYSLLVAGAYIAGTWGGF